MDRASQVAQPPTEDSPARGSSAAGASRVALFGGSFDPPHLGHLAIAHAARTALALDRVLFAPVGGQPLKPDGSSANFAERVALTRLAIAGEPAFELSLLDAPSPNGLPNYTTNTLHNLAEELGPSVVLYCLIGADSFVHLPLWKSARELLFQATFLVAARPGFDLGSVASLLPAGLTLTAPPRAFMANKVPLVHYRIGTVPESRPSSDLLPARSADLFLLPGLDYDLSASRIRTLLHQEYAAEESTLLSLLSATVLSSIRQNRLYNSK